MPVNTNGTTSLGPVVSATSAIPTDNNFVYDISLPVKTYIPSVSGVYTGSLSAQGNLVAMQVNNGGPKLVLIDNPGRNIEEGPAYASVPYLTGFFREYWKDPVACTFGQDSVIPAITGVMPAGSRIAGNAVYYTDLQLTRLAGSNFWNNFNFINSFNQVLTWVTSSNPYLVGLKSSEEKNLEYFRSKTYAELITQGFSNYDIGKALKLAIGNVGKLIQDVPSGYFGTPNSVTKVLVTLGLGSIGNLSDKLTAAEINFADIYNPIYTEDLISILRTITNKSDLETIQLVLKSNVQNISSPLDFTNIEKCSGTPNDSVFQTFAEFGKDLFNRAPGINVTTGQDFLTLLISVLAQVPSNVESLASDTSLLPPSITNALRTYLPESPSGGPVSMLDVIGTASGYLTDEIAFVNSLIQQLSETKYGPQIRAALNVVSNAYNTNYGTNPSSPGQPLTPTEAAYQKAVNDYNSLLLTVKNDPATKTLVDSINETWSKYCEKLSYEVVNYNKANITASRYTDNSIIYSFVESLPSYAADTQNIGTDLLLYGLCQSNQSGDVVKTILGQFKNNQTLSAAGVRITGSV
jgi:hypothetical protein